MNDTAKIDALEARVIALEAALERLAVATALLAGGTNQGALYTDYSWRTAVLDSVRLKT